MADARSLEAARWRGPSTGLQVPWWLRSAHVQTIAPTLDRRSATADLEHVRHELPDGDFVDLHWLGRGRVGPILILLPGMQGTERSRCVRSLVEAASARSLRAVVLCHRGGEHPNRLAGSYHAGFIEHLTWLVSALRASEPSTPLHAVGFSLGGSMLVRYLAEAGPRSGIASAAALSLTFDLASTARRACEGFNRVYQRRVLASYQRVTRLKAHLPEVASRLPRVERARSIRDLDDVLTGPLHGFDDAADYYRQCSSARFLGGVRTPLLVLNASDDPLVAPDSIPAPHTLPSHVQLEVTTHGGHLGFLGRQGTNLGYWAPARVLPFLLQGNGSHP